MVIVLKVIIFLLAVLMLCSLVGAFCYGRKCAKLGHEHLSMHRSYVNISLWVTILLVVTMEGFLYFAEEGAHNEMLFPIHMFFVAVFSVSLVLLRFFYTGLSNRSYHKPIAYICFVAFVGVFLTGGFMITSFT